MLFIKNQDTAQDGRTISSDHPGGKHWQKFEENTVNPNKNKHLKDPAIFGKTAIEIKGTLESTLTRKLQPNHGHLQESRNLEKGKSNFLVHSDFGHITRDISIALHTIDTYLIYVANFMLWSGIRL